MKLYKTHPHFTRYGSEGSITIAANSIEEAEKLLEGINEDYEIFEPNRLIDRPFVDNRYSDDPNDWIEYEDVAQYDSKKNGMLNDSDAEDIQFIMEPFEEIELDEPKVISHHIYWSTDFNY